MLFFLPHSGASCSFSIKLNAMLVLPALCHNALCVLAWQAACALIDGEGMVPAAKRKMQRSWLLSYKSSLTLCCHSAVKMKECKS